MKSRFWYAGLALMAAVAISSRPAHAAVGEADIMAQNVISGTSTDGTWDVTVSSAGGNVWDVTAVADGSSVPDDIAEHVNVAFYSSTADAQAAVSGGGGGNKALKIITNDHTNGTLTVENNNSWPSPSGSDPGGVNAGSTVTWDTATYTNMQAGTAKGKEFNDFCSDSTDPTCHPPLEPDGSTIFQGTITVTDSTNINAVAVRLDDSTVSWRGYAPIVPEPASAALFLPGLFPLALMARRRRKLQA
jgi:hypothetical protein